MVGAPGTPQNVLQTSVATHTNPPTTRSGAAAAGGVTRPHRFGLPFLRKLDEEVVNLGLVLLLEALTIKIPNYMRTNNPREKKLSYILRDLDFSANQNQGFLGTAANAI